MAVGVWLQIRRILNPAHSQPTLSSLHPTLTLQGATAVSFHTLVHGSPVPQPRSGSWGSPATTPAGFLPRSWCSPPFPLQAHSLPSALQPCQPGMLWGAPRCGELRGGSLLRSGHLLQFILFKTQPNQTKSSLIEER